METKLIHVSPELHKKLKLESLERDMKLKDLVHEKLRVPLKSKKTKNETVNRNPSA